MEDELNYVKINHYFKSVEHFPVKIFVNIDIPTIVFVRCRHSSVDVLH